MNGNAVPSGSIPGYVGFFLPTKPGASIDDQGRLVNVTGSLLPWLQENKFQLPANLPTNTTTLFTPSSVNGTPTSTPPLGSIVFDTVTQELWLYTNTGWGSIEGPADTWATVLASGNSSGSNDVIVDQALQMPSAPTNTSYLLNVTRVPGPPSNLSALPGSLAFDTAGSTLYLFNGAIWTAVAAGGATDWAGTLAAGNASGAFDAVMSAGQQIKFTSGLRLGSNNVNAGVAATDALAIGGGAAAAGAAAIALGISTVASGSNSVAIGQSASATFANSVALGAGVATTAANQIVIGQAAATTLINGKLQLPLAAATNTTNLLSITTMPGAPISAARAGSLALDDTNNKLYMYTTASGWIVCNPAAVASTLSAVLAAGNTTGAFDISVDNGQKLTFAGGISISSALAANTVSASGISIGNASTVSLGNGVAIGNSATANGVSDTALGRAASAMGGSSVAVGSGASAKGSSVAVGINSIGFTNGVALGNSANNGAFTNSVALGASATNTANNEIMLGTTSTTVNMPNAARLPNAVATNSTALLNITSMAGAPTSVGVRPGSLALDNTNSRLYVFTTPSGWVNVNPAVVTPTLTQVLVAGNATGANDIFVSSGQNLRFNTGIRLGNNNVLPTSVAATGISIGASTVGTGTNHVSIGTSATTSTFASAVAIGNSANAGASAAIAIGTNSSATAADCVALGNGATCSQSSSVVIGVGANASTGNSSVYIGSLAAGKGTGQVCIGWNAVTNAFASAIAIGVSSQVLAAGSLAIGDTATAAGSNTIVLGQRASSVANNNLSVGNLSVLANATSTNNNCVGHSITLGAQSTGNTCMGTENQIPANYVDCTFVGRAVQPGVATVNNTVFLGAGVVPVLPANSSFYMRTGLTIVGGGANLTYVAATGQIGPVPSSLRYKEDFKEIEDTSSVLDVKIYDYKLKEGHCPCGPVCSKECTYREYGAIAEEVARIYPKTVAYSEDPETKEERPESIRYDRLLLLLIPEVRKLRERVAALEAQLSQ